ncbi:MAG: sirohydrochlorin chelatase [Devosia sp.]|nr:sirohydrochlorin chelatase [Devosia sp.]
MNTPPILPAGTGIMLCGHGSRNQRAVGEFAVLAERLRERLPGVPVEYGYLEFANPVIHLGLDRLRAQGVNRILAVPGMLFAAGHAKNDIPSVLNTYAAGHPGLTITYGRELGVDLKMLRAAGDRVQQAVGAAPSEVARTDTLLLVVGRGASDPDANSNVAKVMRMLWEGMGFGWAEVAYSGVTFPLVAPALDHAARLGYRRIIVFPYFLFTGVLVKRIYDAAAEARAKYPQIEILDAPYLNDHPLVIDTFLDRINEMLVGQNLMNCAMCKYREQVLSFEAEVGLRQESHHQHVEGIGGGLEDCPCRGDCDSSCRDEAFCRKHGLPWTPLQTHQHDHDHVHPHVHAPARHALLTDAGAPLVRLGAAPDHGHPHGHHYDHTHHHHPYPHADHPLGPRTLDRVPGRLAREDKDR